ncbi:hypothetical protein L7F22_006235 [Adiantum nelumboides]|nr:hypothetical protein [Adiantum nelumboides]
MAALLRVQHVALHSLRDSASSLSSGMAAMLPYSRASSSRKLDFEEPQLVRSTPAARFKKRARKTGPDISNEPLPSELDGSLLGDDYEAQNKGLSTYVRRRSRRVLEKDVNTVKNKHGLNSTEVLVGAVNKATRRSSNDYLSQRSSMKTLTLDMQVEASAICENFGVSDVIIAKPHVDLGQKTVQCLPSELSSPTQGSKVANSPLSTTACLNVMPLDVSPSLHRVDTAIVYEGPYPSFPRPLPEDCSEVCHRLSLLHGPLEDYAKHKAVRISNDEVLQMEYYKEQGSKDGPKPPLSAGLQSLSPRMRRTVLDSLVGTMLSQNTTDTNSRRAFASLKERFPTWEAVYEADPKAVEDAIRCGGLAEIKTSRILSILRTLNLERGKLCLEYLHGLSTDEIKLELSRFKGVGPKTIACVLMFHLQQNEFPVDTHVFRITKILGWVPIKADREKAYLHLNHRIPNHLKFDPHCLLVTHGKRCPRCAKGGRAQRPADGPCPLVNLKQQLIEPVQCDLLLES